MKLIISVNITNILEVVKISEKMEDDKVKLCASESHISEIQVRNKFFEILHIIVKTDSSKKNVENDTVFC